MKCNIRELAHMSAQPCVLEGRLNYKKISNGSYRHQAVFKERWFRLINNYLFYFKISDVGTFDTKNPAGVIVMENTSIQMEHRQSIPFSFSISFIDEPEKRHVFATRADENVVQWVMKLRECSYEYLRNRLYTLQSKIYSITGKDPLLLVPRNVGASLWAPAVPFSTVPACTVSTSSFSCHLHTNGAFTLERSKSDVQAHAHIRNHFVNNTTFYTDDPTPPKMEAKEASNHVFALGRSKTSAILPNVSNLVDNSIFDNRPLFSRTAPSPPVRKKLSPSARRADRLDDARQVVERGKNLGITGILDEIPIPPRRKTSPKYLECTSNINSTSDNSIKNDVQTSDDLIKF